MRDESGKARFRIIICADLMISGMTERRPPFYPPKRKTVLGGDQRGKVALASCNGLHNGLKPIACQVGLAGDRIRFRVGEGTHLGGVDCPHLLIAPTLCGGEIRKAAP